MGLQILLEGVLTRIPWSQACQSVGGVQEVFTLGREAASGATPVEELLKDAGDLCVPVEVTSMGVGKNCLT